MNSCVPKNLPKRKPGYRLTLSAGLPAGDGRPVPISLNYCGKRKRDCHPCYSMGGYMAIHLAKRFGTRDLLPSICISSSRWTQSFVSGARVSLLSLREDLHQRKRASLRRQQPRLAVAYQIWSNRSLSLILGICAPDLVADALPIVVTKCAELVEISARRQM